MKIRAFQSLTLTDYPGKIAGLVFTQGCNFACPFCHNKQLLSDSSEELMPESVLFDMLYQRKKLLDGLVITGGEPAVQYDLAEFIAAVKDMGLLIKLDTNGSFPEVLGDLIQKELLDYIAMDVKATWDNYDRAAGTSVDIDRIKQSIQIISQSSIEHEFRTTVVDFLHKEQDIDCIRKCLPDTSVYKTNPYKEYAL